MRNAYTAYLEEEILLASPVRLVSLLYDGAISSLRNARQYLAEQKVAERCAAIGKACNILTELTSSLDYAAGAETAVRLGELYGYCIARLLDANLNKTDAPIAEVLGLLVTVAEAWSHLAAKDNGAPVGLPSPVVYAAAPGEFTSQSWSF